MLVLYDEDENQIREESHEERYASDEQASKKFEAKERAARQAGRPEE
jgi:hypothetical protein